MEPSKYQVLIASEERLTKEQTRFEAAKANVAGAKAYGTKDDYWYALSDLKVKALDYTEALRAHAEAVADFVYGIPMGRYLPPR